MATKHYAEQFLRHELSKATVPPILREEALLSEALEVLYTVATCEGFCRGGDHILESLAGRAVNQCLSALVLTSVGHYDEALSLVRSLGELTNLFAFFSLKPTEFRAWVLASESERIQKYGPSKIRKAIQEAGQIAVPMDNKTYSRLCEAAVHVTPRTAPNQHEPEGGKHVGGVRQEAGEAEVLSQLDYLLPQVAMIAATIVDRRNLLPPLLKLVANENA